MRKPVAPQIKTRKPSTAALRQLPAVGAVLEQLRDVDLPRSMLAALARRELAAMRRRPSTGATDDIIEHIRQSAIDLAGQRIGPVINGTGILIHTNLGRACLPKPAIDAMLAVADQYCNLELSCVTGKRGGRGAYAEAALAALCGADAALIVNNCAAALVLAVRHFATTGRPEVVVSRGELVQIGGGFRIPEMLRAAGATLREVGTTNRTNIKDYAAAIGDKTGLVLKVHRSNFVMRGFVASCGTSELTELCRKKRVPFMEDVGSGATDGTAFSTHANEADGQREPTAARAIKDGAHLVCFSGDKLLGGPQAGIIVGEKAMITALKTNPLFRALRCDKLTLVALQETVKLRLEGRADMVPVSAMAAATTQSLATRADAIIATVRNADAPVANDGRDAAPERGTFLERVESTAEIGGGAAPGREIPSVALIVRHSDMSADEVATWMRLHASPPLVGRIHRGAFAIDLRAVPPGCDAAIAEGLTRLRTVALGGRAWADENLGF